MPKKLQKNKFIVKIIYNKELGFALKETITNYFIGWFGEIHDERIDMAELFNTKKQAIAFAKQHNYLIK